MPKDVTGKDKKEKKERKEKKEKKEKRAKTDEEVLDAGDVTTITVDADMVDASFAEGSPKKVKKEGKEDKVTVSIEELSPIARPLAAKKLLKKVHKTVKRASKARQVKRGVKEVVKGIRKGDKGLLVLAADISPIDIISHLPVLSEEADIPYIFVSSKVELGAASATKRPTSCVLVCPDWKRKKPAAQKENVEEPEDYRELYDEVLKEVKSLDDHIVY
ncbi:L30e-like protein [Calocera cornea HHB12733]|uniref:H/ACA ribonucleoprotein complex subunit 2 n=1 Tax=Calocera cornea HHB12733 TaxID=1353952 RepID=A0A165KCY7_9BASI|nr:L30e-like protein [Calocera cornea HHB12733]